MARYADASRCPDCGAPIPPHPEACPSCRLPLTGPVAAQLYTTLLSADRLLAELKAAPPSAPVPAGAAAPVPTAAPIAPARRGLTGASVPRILLTLGALCLLAAAITFLAVAWTWLGIGGRTAILVALTLVAGASVWQLAERSLRAAAEALCVVTLGLLALDIAGADSAGWFGDLSTDGLIVVSGLVTGLLSFAGASLLRRHSHVLMAPQLIAVGALSAVPLGLVGLLDREALPMTLGCLGLLGVAHLGRRLGLTPMAISAAVGAGVWWLPLAGTGLGRLVDHPTFGDIWLRGQGWPELTATLILGAVAIAVRRHRIASSGLGAVTATMATLIAVFPALDESTNTVVFTLCAATAAWTAAALALPGRWRIIGVVPLVLAFIPPAAVALNQLVIIADTDLAAPTWSESAAALLPGAVTACAPILIPLVAILASVIAVSGARRSFLPRVSWPEGAALIGTAVAGAGLAAVAAYAVPRAAVVAGLLTLAGAMLGWAMTRARDSLLVVSLALGVGAIAILFAHPSSLLVALACLTTGTMGAVVADRSPAPGGRLLGAVVVSPTLAGLVASLGELGAAAQPWTAAGIVILLGALIVVRPEPAFEVSASVSAVLATAWGMERAEALPGAPYLSFLALYLTIGGVFAVISSLVHSSRRELGWVGGALLAMASWVRLYDLDVRTPEAYTLPSALALVLVGLVHLRREPGASTMTALSAGLGLATVPSLLRVLTEDPISLRAFLLGVGCLVLVLGGVRLRWQSPLVTGSVVGSVLVLWETQPYAAALPPWIPIAIAGAVLIGVGITWESRVRDLRRGLAYLEHLR